MKKPNVFERPSDLPELDLKCPICGKTAVFPYKPFCSKRCADVDLNRWLTGAYVIETDEEEETEEKK
ncbi:MAG: DNA gyrase inhibitor YacG [Alphaproteobacteria bacterium]|nr:DNA gyrase inhibitor YacG [Alphaproteobacteria bacterium]